ncbi:MAG: M23 family metallopeptidase, partial [Clostridia bacterium]|nr:M23 family metallopeptidase [Clostridia bacterium]
MFAQNGDKSFETHGDKFWEEIMKKLISVLLALALMLSALPIETLAKTTQTNQYGISTSAEEPETTPMPETPSEEEILLIGGGEEETAASLTASSPVVSRTDGIWLFPMDAGKYQEFSDWCACPGQGICAFCGTPHLNPYWGDTDHTSNYLGHNGIDIAAGIGTAVYAPAAGTVYYTYTDWPSRGYTLIMEHPLGNGYSYYSVFQHLSRIDFFTSGTTVEAGQRIASTGNTDGYGTGQPHLHFGIVRATSGQGFSLAANPNSALSAIENYGWLKTEEQEIGRVLNNPALNSPCGFPTQTNGATLEAIRAHAGSVLYTFDKSEVDLSGSYLNKCKSVPTNAIYRGKLFDSSIKLWTQPCSSATDPSSEVYKTVSWTHPLVVTAYVVNTANNLWYEVLEDGNKCYVWSDNVQFVQYTNDAALDGVSLPSGNLQQGNSFGLYDTITSRHLITSVTATITGPAGQTKTVKPNIHGSFCINQNASGGNINNEIIFNTLPVGNYKYTLTATVVAYCPNDYDAASAAIENESSTIALGTPYTITKSSNFSVVGNVTPPPATPSIPDTITISDYTCPDAIKQGSWFAVRGVITSAVSDLTSVTAGVFDESGTFRTGITVSPNTKTYDLSGEVDASVVFNILPAGFYYYHVSAVNSEGQTILINHRFEVYTDVASTATPTPTPTPTPSPTPTPIGAKANKIDSVSQLNNGDCILITNTSTGKVLSTALAGTNGDQLAGITASIDGDQLTVPSGAALLTVEKNSNGDFLFRNEDGDYLKYSNKDSVVFSANPDDMSLWMLMDKGDGFGTIYICSVNGIYNLNNQYLEYYNSFRPYSWNENYEPCFAMTLYRLSEGEGTVATPPPESGDLDAVWLDQCSYPEALQVGDYGAILGKIYSEYSPLSSIKVGVYGISGDELLAKTVTPNTNEFDLESGLGGSLGFETLGAGDYYFRIRATNATGTTELINAPFVVYTAPATTSMTASSPVVSRTDGIWLFPMDAGYYQYFSDWCACPGWGTCAFHNTTHPAWGDDYHTSNYLGHNGIDISAGIGTAVYAPAAGTVYYVNTNWASRGYTLIMEHPLGNGYSYYSVFQHLSKINFVASGATVAAGQRIASTGNSDGYGTGQPHLHFGLVMAASGQGVALAISPNSALSAIENCGWLKTPGFGTGRILNNPALNSPCGFPTSTQGATLEAIRQHAGSVLYTFNPSQVNIGTCAHKNLKIDHAVAPTCLEAGTSVGVTCTDCNTVLAEQHELSAHGHCYEEKQIPASCSCPPKNEYTCVRCQDRYYEYPDDIWSEWSLDYPIGVAGSCIESKTQYRSSVREVTTSTETELDGWTFCGTETVYSDWSAWSAWSQVPVEANDLTDVQTGELYRYFYYLCAGCGDHNPLPIACGCGSAINSWHEVFSPIRYLDSNPSLVYYANYILQTTSLGDGQLWYFRHGNLNDTEVGTIETDGTAVVIVQGYRSRTRTATELNLFERWTEWSEWQDEPITETEDCKVEIRSIYRFCLVELAEHSLAYSSNGDGTHDAVCINCGASVHFHEECTYVGGICSLCGSTQPSTPTPTPTPTPTTPAPTT